jgi:hypothetical protein
MYPRIWRSAVIAVVPVICSSCADPLVVYGNVVPKPNIDGVTEFQLADSILKFDYPTSPNNVVTPKTLTVTSVPIASTTSTYTISGTDWYQNWGVSTDITVTHTDGSLLLQQVKTAVTDQRVNLINTAAGIGSNVIGLLHPADAGQNKQVSAPPTGLDVSQFIALVAADPQKTGCAPLGQDGTDGKIECSNVVLAGGGVAENLNPSLVAYVADITIDPIPDDAFKASSLTFPYRTPTFLHSACRTLQISVHTAKPIQDQIPVTASVQVNDPNWLQATKLPKTGSVLAGKSCGADAQPGAYTGSTALDYVKALGDAANTIRGAITKNATGTNSTTTKAGTVKKS